MTKAERAAHIDRRLAELYPETPIPLRHEDPFTLLVAVVLNVIYVFNSFPIIWTLTEGGPANQTHIIVTYLYKMAIHDREFGQGYAMAILTFLFLLIFAVAYTMLYGREEVEKM